MIKAKTLGALRESQYTSKSVKDELRDNIIAKIKNNDALFEGIHGYSDSVEPQIIRAILAGHNINFLGLRGQGKTRMARQLVSFLDEYIPALDGTEVLEDPFKPITKEGKELIEKHGDNAPICWIHRNERYFEKLATPDVTIADLVGDIDPVKAANEKLNFSDERVINFGMIPRAHRCIFVINELSDLQPRIQVALFNALQEGDIQIRGFQLRMNLDTHFVFTANPEDYTQRGSIITPLKDRIGSQILTHYPEREAAEIIYAQEAKVKNTNIAPWMTSVGTSLHLLMEEARESSYIDQKSGVSVRLGIAARELLYAAAEERALINNTQSTSFRPVDFLAIIPAIIGKVELVYEGEQIGGLDVAENLISTALHALLAEFNFPAMDKIKSSDEGHPYNKIVRWFESNREIQLDSTSDDGVYRDTLDGIPALGELVDRYLTDDIKDERYFFMETVLWALCLRNRLSRETYDGKTTFFDTLSGYLNDE
ncbi:MAG: AAA family ATPase [Cryomorphaceae bacterium]|nr:AAA family ATPase [Cryomorphaceae bacterium]